MPRDGSDIYNLPPGTYGAPDETIASAKYNAFADDIAQDLNAPRPIIAGGTGSSNEEEALASLGGEVASQVVNNYDSHVFFAGSFRSDAAASASPVSGHAFTGWCYSSDPPAYPPANLNLVIQARDQSLPAAELGRLYVREKKAGVWGVWFLEGEGSGIAFLNSPVFTGNPTTPSPPVDDNDLTIPNTAWVQAELAQLAAAAAAADALKVNKAGDIMTGHLDLPVSPAPAQAVRRDYVDASDATLAAAIAAKLDTSAVPGVATAAQYRANVADKTLDTDGVWSAAVPVVLTDVAFGNYIIADLSLGIDFVGTFSLAGGTRQLSLSNPKPGQKGVIYLVQPPTGTGVNITVWDTPLKFAGGTKPTLSTANNAIDVLAYSVKSASEIMCSFAADYK